MKSCTSSAPWRNGPYHYKREFASLRLASRIPAARPPLRISTSISSWASALPWLARTAPAKVRLSGCCRPFTGQRPAQIRSTAALDARAEVEVYRQFRDVAQGKSVLLISHRLGSARLADRIVVLEEGRIAEQGSHAALVARGGRYAEMYATQAQWYR